MAELLRKQDQVIAIGMESPTGYGQGATVAGSDAILAEGLTVKVLDATTQDRNNVVGYMGGQGAITTLRKVTASFGTEFATSGVANTPPAWGRLLRMCGMGQVTDANSVVYTPVGSGFESAMLLYRIGKVQQRLLGARGKFVLNLDAQSIPSIKYDVEALYEDPTVEVTPLVGVDQSAFKKPMGVMKATTSVSFLGVPVAMSKLSVDLGIGLQFDSNTERESVEYVKRDGTISITFRTTDVELVNAIKNASNNVEGELNYVHGNQVGETLTVNVPNLQVKTAEVSWDGELATVVVTASIKPLNPNTDILIAQS